MQILTNPSWRFLAPAMNQAFVADPTIDGATTKTLAMKLEAGVGSDSMSAPTPMTIRSRTRSSQARLCTKYG